MEEKRRDKRHVVTFPAMVGRQGRFSFVTMTKNVAPSGLLVMTAVSLEVGERVQITYDSGAEDSTALNAEGRIVRVEKNEDERASQFPYLAAVEFADPQPEIETLLEYRLASAPEDEEEG